MSRGKAFKGPHFNGPDYDPELDGERLTGQLRRVFDVVKDRRWHSLSKIAEITGDPESSVSAQLRHLRKERFGGWLIERKRAKPDSTRGLFLYRLAGKKEDQ